MGRQKRPAAVVNNLARAIDLQASVYEQLTPAQEEHLRREGRLPGEVQDLVALVADTPYPLGRETLAAVQAAARHFVLPWSVIRSHHSTHWAADYFEALGYPSEFSAMVYFGLNCLPGGASSDGVAEGPGCSYGVLGISDIEVEAKAEEIEAEMADLAERGEIQAGRCLDLECLPFHHWQLKCVPLREDAWIDRHFIELAEWCALLTKQGYERLPAFDLHPLAWERFFPPGTDWSAPEEASWASLRPIWKEAERHLDGFPGCVKEIGGRGHLRFSDYQGWAGRQVTGDLDSVVLTEPGVVVPSWNAWVMAAERAGSGQLIGVDVGEIPDPGEGLGEAAVLAIEDDRALDVAMATRQGILSGLFGLGAEITRARKQGEEDFVPTPLQQRIYQALYRKQLTTDQLQAKVNCDRKTLFADGGLKGLMAREIVKNKGDRKGYYRPNAPPLLDVPPAAD
jgi:hypothetical protein